MTALDPAAERPTLTPLPIRALVIATWNLLEEANNLPQPSSLSICRTQSIALQFAGDQSGARAVARWATRFGGITVATPATTDDGPMSYVRTEFGYFGITVEAYTFIPADKAA